MATIVTNISDDNSTTPLSPPQGGTGLNAVSTGDLLTCTSANVYSRLSIGPLNNLIRSTGTLVAWDGTGAPLFTVTNASASVSAVACTGYILTSGSLQTVTLPTTFAVGAQIAVQSVGAGGFSLKAGTATTIQYGTSATSSGGALASSNQYDNCFVIGIVANTTWAVTSSVSSGLVVT